MAEQARQSPKFPWDYDVPNNAFWNSLDYRVGRNFLQCFTESEILHMTFDETLPFSEKLKYLRSKLRRTLAEKENAAMPGTPFHDSDYRSWVYLKLGLSTIEHWLGNYGEEEVIVREMYENGLEGKKGMSALHQLSGLMETMERFCEAESMEREVLPWLQGHELLGRDSPQALSGMRTLARTVWKQGRYEEATDWVERCRRTIEDMGNGKFAKYQDDERRQLEDDVRALDQWKEDHGGS